MERNNDNFKDLEGTLRKALASEKQTGLSAKQLNTLHNLIDQGSPVRRKKPAKWWQLSFAGSVLATAVVAFIVVDRFPGEESGPKTETPDTWETWESPQTPPSSDPAVASDRTLDKKPGGALKEEVQSEFKSAKSGSKAPDAKKENRSLANEKASDKVTTSKKKQKETFDRRKLAKPKSDATVNLRKLGNAPVPAAPATKKPVQAVPASAKPAEIASVQPKPGPSAAQAKTKSQDTWDSGASGAKKLGRAEPSKSAAAKNKGEATPPAFGLGGVAGKDSALGDASGAGSTGGAMGTGSAGLGSSLQNSGKRSSTSSGPGMTSSTLVEIAAINTTDNSGQILVIVKSRANHIRRCYDTFDATTNKGGSITAWFSVTKAGRVSSAKITSGYAENEKLQDCVVDAINRWRFPKNAPATVEVIYKFTPL